MKPEELCIGDWVRRRWTCTDTGREVVRDFQITEIRKNGETLYAWGKGGNMGRVEKLEPIPLTPETLEKNGFHYTNEHTLKGADTYILRIEQRGYDLKVTIKLNDYFALDSYDDRVYRLVEISTGKWYVHHLQHALRLCGIDLDIEL